MLITEELKEVLQQLAHHLEGHGTLDSRFQKFMNMESEDFLQMLEVAGKVVLGFTLANKAEQTMILGLGAGADRDTLDYMIENNTIHNIKFTEDYGS